MSFEIERKFLVNHKKLPHTYNYKIIYQAYLLYKPIIHIRIITDISQGYKKSCFLTYIGKSTLIKKEFKFKIPYFIALFLSIFSLERITKIRNYIKYKNKIWEVDEFLINNLKGFYLANLKLNSLEEFELPFWATKEVTNDFRYSDVYLVKYGIPNGD